MFISEWEKDGKRDLISEYKKNIEIKNCSKSLNENIEKITFKKATQRNIYSTIFKTVAKEKGKLLFVYWIGHGYTTGVKNRQLLYSDSDEVIPTFNFSLFLESLLTDTFSGFNQQIFFIDACANFPKVKYKNEQHYLAPDYTNENREQLTFYAAQRGYKAIIDKKTSIFSDILLTILSTQLEKFSSLNIDDFNKLSVQIKKIFQEKYPQKKYRFSLWHGIPDGSEVPILLNPIEKQDKILDDNWDDFAKIISELKDNIIEDLVKQFLLKYYSDPNSICSNLFKDSNKLKDNNFFIIKEILLMIIEEEKRNNQLPIILEFCLLICKFQLEEIKSIKSKLQLENIESIKSKLQLQLEKIELINSKLNEWAEAIAKELNVSDDILKQFNNTNKQELDPLYSQGLPYLVILFEQDLEESSKNQSNNKFDIKLKPELRFQEKVDSQENIVCKATNNKSISVNENNIYQEIYRLIQNAHKQLRYYGNKNQLTIELFLPIKYLVNSDFIPEVEAIPNNEIDSGWFGSRYKLVFRCSDRFDIEKSDRYNNLLTKWDILNQLNCQSLCSKTIKEKTFCIKQPTSKYNWRKLPQKISKSINVNLNCPLLEKSYQLHIESFFTYVLRCGIPFAFWLRGNSLENLKLREEERITNTEFEELLTVENVKNYDHLFESIKSIREDAYGEGEEKYQEYLGYHLGFLFDNPYRFHSNFDIDWGGDTLAFNV